MAIKSLAELLGNKTVFGDYVVIGEGKKCSKGRYALCRCKCGAVKDVGVDKLRTGRSTCCKSCAASSEKRITNLKHGMTRTPEYYAWRSMLERCVNPKAHNFKRYGDRGITVCDSWVNSFEQFFADMGERPSSRHSLDRKNNSKGYEPGNCRWALPVEQSANRDVTLMIEVDGVILPMSVVAAKHGMSPATLAARIKMGWSVERALTEKVADKKPVHDVNGRPMKASDIEREFGIPRQRLNMRLRKGMSVTEAIALG